MIGLTQVKKTTSPHPTLPQQTGNKNTSPKPDLSYYLSLESFSCGLEAQSWTHFNNNKSVHLGVPTLPKLFFFSNPSLCHILLSTIKLPQGLIALWS